MKKKTPHILLFCCSIIILASCSTSGYLNQSKIVGPIEKVVVKNKRTALADSLENYLENCSANQGCGLNHDYCNLPQCEQIIIDCHEIDVTIFNALTNNMSDGHATFEKSQIEEVLNGAVCGSDWIRCYIRKRWLLPDYFRIGRLPHHNPEDLDYETFYSVRLLKGIYDKQITSIVLYRGTMTSSGDLIVPFLVNYEDGTIGYFDVSNDLP